MSADSAPHYVWCDVGKDKGGIGSSRWAEQGSNEGIVYERRFCATLRVCADSRSVPGMTEREKMRP